MENNTPPSVPPEEILGRGVFSRQDARKAQRGVIPRNVFLERQGVATLSVDRLDLMESRKAVALGEERAPSRGPNARFLGWAAILAEDAAKDGRRVFATPIPGSNPYHADIQLPTDVAGNRRKQRVAAQKMADDACWQCRPDENPENLGLFASRPIGDGNGDL